MLSVAILDKVLLVQGLSSHCLYVQVCCVFTVQHDAFGDGIYLYPITMLRPLRHTGMVPVLNKATGANWLAPPAMTH